MSINIQSKFVRIANGALSLGQYADGSLAVQVRDSDQPVETLSINLGAYGLAAPEGHFYCKDYSEHEGLPEALVKAGVASIVHEVTFGPFGSKAFLMHLNQPGVDNSAKYEGYQALHIGLLPDTENGVNNAQIVLNERTWSPHEEESVTLLGIDSEVKHEAWVSGSMGCWGPADQDTDGDNTLHVVVHFPRIDDQEVLVDFIVAAYIAVGDNLDPETGVPMMHGYLTDAVDYSEDVKEIHLVEGGVAIRDYER